MGSHWFVYITGTPESISNPTNFFFWIWWFFSWAVFCHRLFWSTGFVHVRLRSFVKWDKDSSTTVSLSWVPWFSAVFISSDFDIFIIELVLSSKFVLNFLSLLDIWCKEALSTIDFLNAMTSMVRKGLITFYFKKFFLMKMLIIKSKPVVKTASVFEN